MFGRSSSGKLFFLRRETHSKENAKRKRKKNNFYSSDGNCYKFQSAKVRVTHS
jgi:hypothetical protein